MVSSQFFRFLRRVSLLCALLAASSFAQESASQPENMSGMQMPGMNMGAINSAGTLLMSNMSGTAVNPAAWMMPMLMKPVGSWHTMFMAEAFIDDTQQSGPRGGDKLYSPNWFMGNAEHAVGSHGAFQFQLMLSLDPATITDRRYPLLFQTGETAFGKPIVDGQHPHNFIMSLGFQYAFAVSENVTFELYFAPVGDPALGPIAYPHRASAMELPQAPISHHLEDSTHISDDVITAGLAYKTVRVEASGFYGSEPGENRWTIQQGPINSWSTRVWYFPGKNWAAEVSTGHLTRPEALEPGDQTRTNASLEYAKPMPQGSWSSSLIWGRVHNTYSKHNLTAYTAESVLPIGRQNFVTGRIDIADKDELFADEPAVEELPDSFYGSIFRIAAFTLGYTRNVNLFRYVETGVGANIEAYSVPHQIERYYGDHPVGGNVFIRLRFRAHA